MLRFTCMLVLLLGLVEKVPSEPFPFVMSLKKSDRLNKKSILRQIPWEKSYELWKIERYMPTDATKQNVQKAIQTIVPILDSLPFFKEWPATNLSEQNFIKATKIVGSFLIFKVIQKYAHIARYESTYASMALDFLYTPLILAQKGGVNPLDYIQSLATLHFSPKSTRDSDVLEVFVKSFNFFSLTHSAIQEVSAKDWNILDSLRTMFIRAWFVSWLVGDRMLDQVVDASLLPYVHAIINYAISNSFSFFYDTPFYLDALFKDHYMKETAHAFFACKDIPTQFLQAYQERVQNNPQICFNPGYLTQKTQKACNDAFKTPSKALVGKVKTYLQNKRLISIDNVPCVFLNKENKIWHAKLQNPICKTIQAF
ncbi:hypothetical protein ACFOPX_01775 [Helicobacter baculiformis]|uniref:OMP9 n=1 Tax=Helicobacter baculiformis TaxID=427351 RepID=A0A1M4NGX0_9HELI|nr:hypothetical protein [Helicobacter baculiformis]SFZ71498.1 OMP9 [Helicobacter baculiformis]